MSEITGENGYFKNIIQGFYIMASTTAAEGDDGHVRVSD